MTGDVYINGSFIGITKTDDDLTINVHGPAFLWPMESLPTVRFTLQCSTAQWRVAFGIADPNPFPKFHLFRRRRRS